jgi:uncharacterized protein YfaT (DUF1175 family)
MIKIITRTRVTLLLLLLWFAFVFVVAYISPGLREKKTAPPAAARTTAKPPTSGTDIRPDGLKKVSDTRSLDSDNDGIPDAAELSTHADRESFRRWFTLIAEMQFYHLSDQWNPEQRDCAGLVRFAWREALHRHDRLWFQKMGPGYQAVAPDVSGSEESLLGNKLFRTDSGRYEPGDQARNFSEFADGRTLKNYNTVFVSRDRRRALPGDLLLFYQPWVQKFPYHVMIFLGDQSVAPEGANDWVVYHTGSSPTGEGMVKKVQLSVLDHHPDARWRPLESNRNFIGFYRLKILE